MIMMRVIPLIVHYPPRIVITQGTVSGVTPGDNSLIITKPGYQPLTLSYHICDCKYTFVSFTLKKTPPVIKPGSANFPAAIFTTLPKLDKPTLVAKVTTTAAAQGSGSKIGVSGSQNFGAAAGALSDSTQDGSSSGNQQTGSYQTGSSSGNQQTGSGSGPSSPGQQQPVAPTPPIPAPSRSPRLRRASRSSLTASSGASPPPPSPASPRATHTLLLKLDGYTDLSTPVSITAGKTTEYTTGLATTAKSPGFGAVFGIIALGAIFYDPEDAVRITFF